MLPVGLLYQLVRDMLGGTLGAARIPFYGIGCITAAALIFVCTRLQYDGTFLTTYVEAGVRWASLAEKLRRIPLSFFGKRNLADLTSSIMNDCAVLEQSQSHFVGPLFGAILSTTLIAVSTLFFHWKMALAVIWSLPIAFAIVALASDVQKRLSRRSMAAKLACEDGIQECMESMADLHANNAETAYLSGLEKKIHAVEGRAIKSELGTAVFVVSAGLVLWLGIATTALVGAALLVKGELDVLTFFLFLLVASRLYDPLEGSLQNLAGIIATNSNIERINEILNCTIQTGEEKLRNQGCGAGGPFGRRQDDCFPSGGAFLGYRPRENQRWRHGYLQNRPGKAGECGSFCGEAARWLACQYRRERLRALRRGTPANFHRPRLFEGCADHSVG